MQILKRPTTILENNKNLIQINYKQGGENSPIYTCHSGNTNYATHVITHIVCRLEN